jgi:hypothetical protein
MYTVNMSKSKSKVSALLGLDSFMGVKIPGREEIKAIQQGIRASIEASEGISQIESSEDMENFIFIIGFHFNSVPELSACIDNAIRSVDNRYNAETYGSIYTLNEKSFQRNGIPKESNSEKIKHQAAKIALLYGANYTCIYRFAKPVGSNRPAALLSKDKKAIMYKLPITELIKQPNLISQTIQIH